MSRAGLVTTATLLVGLGVGIKKLPFESHTSDIPHDTPADIVAACSATNGSSFEIAGLQVYWSTHTRIDSICAASVEVERQANCAAEEGIANPSSVVLAAGGYCPARP